MYLGLHIPFRLKYFQDEELSFTEALTELEASEEMTFPEVLTQGESSAEDMLSSSLPDLVEVRNKMDALLF